jgi:RHS repeat-associated protein
MYQPFGVIHIFEKDEVIDNSFKFTGQYYDSEIDQYYLRARQYYPRIQRFTARDPVAGKFDEPMSLHAYLYCRNNPSNSTDPTGLWDDGLRYILSRPPYNVSNALTLSDQALEASLKEKGLWNNLDYPIWHGHSDFGYLQGDFDYTSLDNRFWTQPVGCGSIPLWLIGSGAGTELHFKPLGGASGSEMLVGLAILSGDTGRFEDAMHMGQDYFSHLGKGYNPVTHALTYLEEDGMKGHKPDNPYTPNPDDLPRTLDSAYLEANKWTKQWEEAWYLIWDTEKWYNLH